MKRKSKLISADVYAAEVDRSTPPEPARTKDDVEVLLEIAKGLGNPVKAFEVRRRTGYLETVSRVELDNET